MAQLPDAVPDATRGAQMSADEPLGAKPSQQPDVAQGAPVLSGAGVPPGAAEYTERSFAAGADDVTWTSTTVTAHAKRTQPVQQASGAASTPPAASSARPASTVRTAAAATAHCSTSRVHPLCVAPCECCCATRVARSYHLHSHVHVHVSTGARRGGAVGSQEAASVPGSSPRR